jgi:hypothetical protein
MNRPRIASTQGPPTNLVNDLRSNPLLPSVIRPLLTRRSDDNSMQLRGPCNEAIQEFDRFIKSQEQWMFCPESTRQNASIQIRIPRHRTIDAF